MTISIINYGCGNIGSVVNMLKHIGVDVEVITESEQVKKATKFILPGVGKWDAGVQSLKESGVLSALEERVLNDKVPLLGICLGMQLLLNTSEEGQLPGLGWIDGTVKTFDFKHFDSIAKRLAVPHMGWNSVEKFHKCPLTESLTDESKFYFVHSFYVEVEDRKNILLRTHYGHDFTSGIRKENIYGLQFHPEKSHKHGMNVMKSFAGI
jgi:glutamine amidotransferase